MVFTSSMYSKILGPSPQGLMQSWFGAVGGLARIVAPILVTHLYTNFGPRWTFISVDTLVVMCILLFIVTSKKLIPYHMYVLGKTTNTLSSSSSIDTTIETHNDVNMNPKDFEGGNLCSGGGNLCSSGGNLCSGGGNLCSGGGNLCSGDALGELSKPVMRNTLVKYEHQYRTRPNSWSLVDRSSFYCSDTDFI